MEFGKSLVAQTLSMEGDFHLWWIYPNPGVPLFMQQRKGQSQNLLCLRSSPLLTTVTQLHNQFQLRLPSKMQLVSDMFNSKWSKITMSESLSLTASPSELPNVNGPQSTIATQVEGIKPQVTWATARLVSWGPMHHMRAAVSTCHQPSCKIGIRLVIFC